MFNFDLKETAIYQSVKWSRHPIFRFAGVFKKIFFWTFGFTFLIFWIGFLSKNFSLKTNKVFFGLSVILLVLSVACWYKEKLFNSKLKNPRLKINIKGVGNNFENYNLAGFLSLDSAWAVLRSIRFVRTKKLPIVSSSILFYFLLIDNPRLDFIFYRAILNLKGIKKLLKSHLKSIGVNYKISNQIEKEIGVSQDIYSDDFKQTILDSFKLAIKNNHQRIEVNDILVALSKNNPIFKDVLINSKIDSEGIEDLSLWQENIEMRIDKNRRFWDYDNLLKKGTLGKEWTSGYTVTLDKYSVDWSENIKAMGFPEIVGHNQELKQVQRALARQEINNVLLIGRPGTGRKSIIYDLARRSILGKSLPEVNYKRIVELDLPTLLSDIETVDMAEAVLNKIFEETITAGNIILVINEFHNFVGSESGVEKPGIIDISGIISSYLHLPQFQIIAVTTYSGLHKYIEQKPSILNLFEKVEVSETSEKETLVILENIVPRLEAKYKRFISYPALRDIISLSKRYITDLPFPKKAIDLLGEVVIYVENSTKDKVVMPEHIEKIVSDKTQIPVGKIGLREKEVLLNLEQLIHKRIINQEVAVKDISVALRRARAGIEERKRPMGTFLFLGPTGVGKTETSKALAEVYFGSEDKMIRLDMSEFQSISDIPRLIGSPGQEGLLTTPVLENPFSLILLDELEKAHPNILNLFLQVFDDGRLTDGQGRKVDFKNSIIIATSNAGYKIILESLEKRVEWGKVKNQLLDFLFQKAIYRPEFINRFDAVVVFKPLTKENLLDIAELLLQKIKRGLKEKGIEFIITLPLKEKIVELSYDPKFGAREMRRVIQDKVENVIAEALLSDKLKRGSTVEMTEEFKLVFKR